jgi:diguanylate cyclase (GGDEF)-like protein/PAS domain S-box-containing protein
MERTADPSPSGTVINPAWFERYARLPGTVLCLLGPDGSYAAVSQSVARTLGYSPAEWMALGPQGTLNAKDLETLQIAGADIRDRPGRSTQARIRVRHKNGSWRWVDLVGTNLIDDPEVGSLLVEFRDVTDQVAAQAEVVKSEERHRAIVQHSADAIVVAGPDGTFIYASPATERVLERRPEDLIGTNGFEIIHPDDVEDQAAGLLQVVEDPTTTVRSEARILLPDGSIRWVEGTIANLMDDPAIGGVVVTFRDATERHLAQEQVAASERRFRTLVSSSTDILLVSQEERGGLMYVSPSIEHVLGWTPEDFSTQYATLVHPDDAHLMLETSEVVRRGGQKVARAQGRIRSTADEWRTFEVTVTNLLDDPDVAGVVTNLRDVTERVAAEESLRASDERFRVLVHNSTEVTAILDSGAVITWMSPTIHQALGRRPEDMIGHSAAEFIHPDDQHEALESLEFLLHEPKFPGPPLTARALAADGSWRTIELSATNLLDNPHVKGVLVSFRDVTDRVLAEADTARLTEIVEASTDLVTVTDAKGQCLYMNEACIRFFATTPDDVHRFDFAPYSPRWVHDLYEREILPTLQSDSLWSGEMAYVRDGLEVPVSALFVAHRDDEGDIEFVSSVVRDISERKQFEAQLEHEATHDPLTGLPNRTLLLDRLTVALARADRHEKGVAVLFLDLDRFKVVNDSLGHGVGDRLLVAAAERLSAALRPGDTVARFGGDEFVILCEDLDDKGDADVIAERVAITMADPFHFDEVEVFVTVSTGISYSDASVDPESMVRDADAAMYQAKAKGRAQWVVFDRRMREMAVDRLDVENALRHALGRHELRIAYQPEIDLTTGRIIGVEALLRWEHPQRGLLLPGEFIGVAEETGLIVPIGTWVLDRTCRQVQRWQAALPQLPSLTAAVNLSSRQLSHPDLADDVAKVLSETGIDPGHVALEITESVLMEDVEASRRTLDALKALGVRIIVDDFGTGYSSLAYLRRFPVDMLKIDQSFIDGLGDDPSDTAIVAAVISLAHTLGLEAVGEGVETDQQLAELRRLECDHAQGFLMARPLWPDDLGELLAADPTF